MANKQIIDYASGAFSNTAVTLRQPAAGGIYEQVTAAALIGFKVRLSFISHDGFGNVTESVLFNTTTLGTISWGTLAGGSVQATGTWSANSFFCSPIYATDFGSAFIPKVNANAINFENADGSTAEMFDQPLLIIQP